MPESSDFSPAPWASYDTFKDARAAYDVHVGRSYDDAVRKALPPKSLVPDSISTDSAAPIIIFCDQTGSMGDWPAQIFAKLPYLDHEARFYFGDDYKIAFGAIGDADTDPPEQYPLQIRPFTNGKELETKLKELVVEGKGGGQYSESYELGALYAEHNIECSNAIRPILIFIGDEMPKEVVSPEQAEHWCGIKDAEPQLTLNLFERLKQKYSVYLVRKPYGTSNVDGEDSLNKQIRETWEKLLGADHIAILPNASRVVDVIFGIFAKETGKIDEFKKELVDRQGKDRDGKDKINVVMKSLNTIHSVKHEPPALSDKKSLKKLPAGAVSVTRRSGSGPTKTSKGLLD